MRRWAWLVVPILTTPGCPALNARPAPAPGETLEQRVVRQAAELDRSKAREAELTAQVKALHEQLAAAERLQAEFADAEIRVERVVLGRYSHVADFDKARPGPEGLKVYLYLYDRTDEKVKRAGRIELKAFDLATERKLGHWTFDPREALKHWRWGFLLDCYVFELPWQEGPGAETVVLRWEFQALDGRRFTGSQELGYSPAATP